MTPERLVIPVYKAGWALEAMIDEGAPPGENDTAYIPTFYLFVYCTVRTY